MEETTVDSDLDIDGDGDGDGDGGEETEEVTFTHKCRSCGHVIAHHYYRSVYGPKGEQRFLMECLLCGRGADERTTEPTRPHISAAVVAAAAGEQGGGEELQAAETPTPAPASAATAVLDAVQRIEFPNMPQVEPPSGGGAAETGKPASDSDSDGGWDTDD